MKFLFFLASILWNFICFSQKDTSKILRAFPITDYIIELTDSSKLVQLEMPDTAVVKLNNKQTGILWGVYNARREDAVQKGYVKCHLVKGNYYYFAVTNMQSQSAIKEGDLIYTFLNKTNIYEGILPKLAAHFIRLKDVYEEPFYDRYLIFLKWTQKEEQEQIDSMVRDIRFTGNYFIENNPAIDKPIINGKYAGKKTLSVMTECESADLLTFFDYVLARPAIYAGKEWKISEIFATWLSEGAPTIIKEK